jgi:plastocyanin
MQRLDPVGITINLQKQTNTISFVPDPAGLIQTGGIIFFSNDTSLQLDITLAGQPLGSVGPKAQSSGFQVPASGSQVLSCSNHSPTQPYTLQVSDQFTLIQPPAGAGATFLPLQLSAGNWILWQNNDTQTHQPVPDPRTTWTVYPNPVAPYSWSQIVQFPWQGNFPYHCNLHPTEVGRIVVAGSIISISGGQFSPASQNVSVGTWVVWDNKDNVAHEPVPNQPPAWTSLPGSVNPNDFSNAVLFNAAGSFSYSCKLHPAEKGTIVVA